MEAFLAPGKAAPAARLGGRQDGLQESSCGMRFIAAAAGLTAYRLLPLDEAQRAFHTGVLVRFARQKWMCPYVGEPGAARGHGYAPP